METQAYFTNIRSHISAELKKANDCIYVAVAWFTDPKLLAILCDKAKEGKDVQLIMMNDDINRAYGVNYNELETCGGKVYLIDGDTGKLMHNKFCVVDGSTTITGSYNWSNKAQSNHENITITTDSTLLAESFIDEFKRIKVLYHGKDALIRFDAEIVCKRLLIIDNLIQLEEYDQILLHQTKINEYELTVEVQSIISALETSDFVSTSVQIRDYLIKIKSLAKYNDVDLERLKWEIKYLETEILAIENEKVTIEKIISDFIHTYTLAFGELLSKILKLKKERLQKAGNDERSKEYEEAEKEFRDFKEQYRQEKKKEFYDLSADEKEDLKKLYRKAATLCHPDRFTDEDMKAKAHLVFIELQEAYAKNDLKRVKEILDKLEKGIYDIEQKGSGNKKQDLLDRINYLRSRLNEITKSVNDLLISKSYKDIITIKNMDTFFEEEKDRLEKELNNLEK